MEDGKFVPCKVAPYRRRERTPEAPGHAKYTDLYGPNNLRALLGKNSPPHQDTGQQCRRPNRHLELTPVLPLPADFVFRAYRKTPTKPVARMNAVNCLEERAIETSLRLTRVYGAAPGSSAGSPTPSARAPTTRPWANRLVSHIAFSPLHIAAAPHLTTILHTDTSDAESVSVQSNGAPSTLWTRDDVLELPALPLI
ncbi:hypothetical protein B0H14DRAFT_3423270 [Mycena olivaceomarginata]|nr:hypothetical protein B0H14DRAFT_3423270 [Mycena olivaceomarginata]